MSGGANDGFGGGRRKDGRPYLEGNTADDGSYIVGRNRTPEASRFRVGDGRPRGRRRKGTENADTFFERELNRRIPVREGGKDRRVTKGQGIDIRLISNAGQGQNRAIEMVDQRRRRIAAEKEETARRYHSLRDEEILRQYLLELSRELEVDPGLFGDPSPDPGEADNPAERAGGKG